MMLSYNTHTGLIVCTAVKRKINLLLLFFFWKCALVLDLYSLSAYTQIPGIDSVSRRKKLYQNISDHDKTRNKKKLIILNLCAGYEGDGKTCTQTNICDTNNGGCHPLATCSSSPGKYTYILILLLCLWYGIGIFVVKLTEENHAYMHHMFYN